MKDEFKYKKISLKKIKLTFVLYLNFLFLIFAIFVFTIGIGFYFAKTNQFLQPNILPFYHLYVSTNIYADRIYPIEISSSFGYFILVFSVLTIILLIWNLTTQIIYDISLWKYLIVFIPLILIIVSIWGIFGASLVQTHNNNLSYALHSFKMSAWAYILFDYYFIILLFFGGISMIVGIVLTWYEYWSVFS